MYVENRTKIANFHTPRVFNAPADGVPLGIFLSAQGSQKTRMMGLSDGRKSFPIGLAVLIQYRSVTDTQPPSQPPSHVAVAITLNALAKASSLKMKLLQTRWMGWCMLHSGTGTNCLTFIIDPDYSPDPRSGKSYIFPGFWTVGEI